MISAERKLLKPFFTANALDKLSYFDQHPAHYHPYLFCQQHSQEKLWEIYKSTLYAPSEHLGCGIITLSYAHNSCSVVVEARQKGRYPSLLLGGRTYSNVLITLFFSRDSIEKRRVNLGTSCIFFVEG